MKTDRAVDARASSDRDRKNRFGRRDFGRLVILSLAGSTLAAASPAKPASGFGASPAPFPPPQEDGHPAVSPSAQAEVQAKLRRVYARFGSRIREDQKPLLSQTVGYHVRMLEVIRAIPEANGDPPATVLKLLHDGPRSLGGRTSSGHRTTSMLAPGRH